MRLPLFLFFVVLACYQCTETNPATTTPDSTSENITTQTKTFDIQRGVNISHWLSQSKARGIERAQYFTAADVQAIAAAGFDHIRIPMDEVQMWDESGNKKTDAFDLLHQAIKWASENQLKVLVDLHIIRAHHFLDEEPELFTKPEAQVYFVELWQQLSKELQDYSTDQVAYELLNEAVAKDPADWNKVFRMAYDAVRAVEPERVIFIGSNRWQQVQTFPDLEVPENDSNIVLSFHFYNPFLLTHHQASWTKNKIYTGNVHYPGYVVQPSDTLDLPAEVRQHVRSYTQEPSNQESLAAAIQIAINKADSLGLQLYCGEFGCLSTVPDRTRKRWFADMIQFFETNNIAWTAWDYKSDGFGVFKSEDLTLRFPEQTLGL